MITEDISPVGYMLGINKAFGYLKVIVGPANNTATAQEWIVGTVKHDGSADKPEIYEAPKMIDGMTFLLKH